MGVEGWIVDLKVLGQPYRGSSATGQTFLTNALADQGVDNLLVVTAWVRESGMRLIAPGVEALRARGGSARLFFGVDLRGTSRQGVEIGRRCFTVAHAVHDPAGGTFHPKMYLAYGKDIAYVLVGSNNLTAGGLWHNYEAAVLATFDPRSEPDLLLSVEEYAGRLLSDQAICRKVTGPVLRRLVSEGWLADEAKDSARRNEDRPRVVRGLAHDGGEPLFQTSLVEKRIRPAPIPEEWSMRAVPRHTRRRLASAPDTWWKALSDGDVQRPLAGNPTGNVTLVNVPAGYDRITYFRNAFFGGEKWSVHDERGKRSELATIRTKVDIEGEDVGNHELTIVYREYRKARGRATTVLRWGDRLLAELQIRDIRNRYLLIERADLRIYRLRVLGREPG